MIYAINTVGAILGSLLAGFVLIPLIGLHTTIRIVAAISALTAIGILIGAPRGSGQFAAFAMAVAVLIAAAIVPEWNRSLLSSGAYKYAIAVRGGKPRERADRRRPAVVPRRFDRTVTVRAWPAPSRSPSTARSMRPMPATC